MRKFRPALETRSPQSLLRDLRQDSIRAERAVVLTLFLSACTLVLAIAHGQAAVS